MPGTRCTVAMCKNSLQNKKKNLEVRRITYHRFPKDTERRKTWIALCQRDGKWNPNSCHVCSDHFNESDYERDLYSELMNVPRKYVLKQDAVPSRNLPSESLQPAEPQMVEDSSQPSCWEAGTAVAGDLIFEEVDLSRVKSEQEETLCADSDHDVDPLRITPEDSASQSLANHVTELHKVKGDPLSSQSSAHSTLFFDIASRSFKQADDEDENHSQMLFAIPAIPFTADSTGCTNGCTNMSTDSSSFLSLSHDIMKQDDSDTTFKIEVEENVLNCSQTNVLVEDAPGRCGVCDLEFEDADDIVRHQEMHPREQPFSCGKCCKTFNEKPALRMHIDDNDCCCLTCGEVFWEKDVIELHYRTNHRELPFKCVTCDKQFFNERIFKNHLQSHLTNYFVIVGM